MLADSASKKLFQTIQERRTVTLNQEHDLSLIRRIAEQDESSLRELYTVYDQRMYAYALRLTDLPQIADDSAQDMLVAVWQSAGRFRGEGRVCAGLAAWNCPSYGHEGPAP